jgi:hypothetical protein
LDIHQDKIGPLLAIAASACSPSSTSVIS